MRVIPELSHSNQVLAIMPFQFVKCQLRSGSTEPL